MKEPFTGRCFTKTDVLQKVFLQYYCSALVLKILLKIPPKGFIFSRVPGLQPITSLKNELPHEYLSLILNKSEKCRTPFLRNSS